MQNSKQLLTPVKQILILFIGILSVSTASLMIRYAQVDVPSIVIAFYRLGTAVVVLAPIAIMRYKRQLFLSRQLFLISKKQWLILILAGLFLSLHFAAWITSLEYTTITSSVVLTTTVPLWVSILSPVLLHERINKYVFIGMVTALIGGGIVGIANLQGPGNSNMVSNPALFFSGDQIFGNFLALTGAWMSAGYLMIGRSVRSNISLVPYTFIVYGISALFLLIYIFFSNQSLVGYPKDAYFWMIGLGLIPQLLGHSSFNWALKYISAAIVAVALLGEPIGATILGMIFIHEIPSNLEIAGGVLILTGIFLASRTEKV